jgi:hypothetical protein
MLALENTGIYRIFALDDLYALAHASKMSGRIKDVPALSKDKQRESAYRRITRDAIYKKGPPESSMQACLDYF